MAWPEFVGLWKRTVPAEARDLLTAMDAVSAGIAQAFGGKNSDTRAVRESIRRMAYPEDPETTRKKVEHLKQLEQNRGP